MLALLAAWILSQEPPVSFEERLIATLPEGATLKEASFSNDGRRKVRDVQP